MLSASELIVRRVDHFWLVYLLFGKGLYVQAGVWPCGSRPSLPSPWLARSSRIIVLYVLLGLRKELGGRHRVYSLQVFISWSVSKQMTFVEDPVRRTGKLFWSRESSKN